MSAAECEQIVFPIEGMDCADCARHVERAIAAIPGVGAVTVLLTAEKALVTPAGEAFDPAAIRTAVAAAGYRVPERNEPSSAPPHPSGAINTTRVVALLALVVALVLGVVVAERMELTDRLNDRLPWPASAR
jgi:Cd2+/Zn2+-exporting ATPase/Cu+-exporting ATPase